MTTITYKGETLKLKGKALEPPSATLTYRIELNFTHVATLRMIEADCDGKLDNERVIPKDWQLNSACDSPEPWVEFFKDEPFDDSEVWAVLRKINIFDQAAHLMTDA